MSPIKLCFRNFTSKHFITNSVTSEVLDEQFDFSGDWVIEASELNIDKSCFTELSDLHNKHWSFLERQADAVTDPTETSRSPLDDFNKTKGNLVGIRQLFRGKVRFVHTQDAGGGIGERQSLSLFKMDEAHPLKYIVGKVEINGRLMEARYSFDAKNLDADDTMQLLESRGDLKLTAASQNELRGGYVGFEPFDMSTPPEMPKREFPIVLGILKATRTSS